MKVHLWALGHMRSIIPLCFIDKMIVGNFLEYWYNPSKEYFRTVMWWPWQSAFLSSDMCLRTQAHTLGEEALTFMRFH